MPNVELAIMVEPKSSKVVSFSIDVEGCVTPSSVILLKLRP
jgi:hypothetical protein